MKANTNEPALAGLELPSPTDWSPDAPDEALDLYFEALAPLLGPDRTGYRNHCQRVLIHARALIDPALDLSPVVPALVFHDIGLWTHRTVAYIEPSAAVADEHLVAIGREEWRGPVAAMVEWHHLQRPYSGPHAAYVEPVRRADMGDFTFGWMGRVPKEAQRAARSKYPNAGFHAMLTRRALVRLVTKPWSPLPMMRWSQRRA